MLDFPVNSTTGNGIPEGRWEYFMDGDRKSGKARNGKNNPPRHSEFPQRLNSGKWTTWLHRSDIISKDHYTSASFIL